MKRLIRRVLGAGLVGAMLVPLALAQPAASASGTIVPYCPRVITNADAGKTITLVAHTCATLRLSGGLIWSEPTSSSTSVRVIDAPGTSSAQQWFLEAVHRGNATITSSGRPRCAPRMPCPQFILLFRVRIHVVAPPIPS